MELVAGTGTQNLPPKKSKETPCSRVGIRIGIHRDQDPILERKKFYSEKTESGLTKSESH